MSPDFFPAEESIPASAQLPLFLEQREYWINGELRRWEGELNPVVSPVFVKSNSAGASQKIIGSTPLLTSVEAMQALDAAVAAYDLGHGVWPRMTVIERIEHVESLSLVNKKARRPRAEGIRPAERSDLFRCYDILIRVFRPHAGGKL